MKDTHTMKPSQKYLPGVAAALLALTAGAANAQSAGSLQVKIGVNQISPQVDSGNLSAPSQPNTKIDVKSATSAILSGTYMLTDHVSVEGYVGLPYKHDIVGDGTIAGVGKIGTVKQVSPTVFGQYRFLEANSKVRPYVGLGLTYAKFYGEEGTGALTALTNPGGPATRHKVDAAWGLSPQIGTTLLINDKWFVDASVIKTFLKTTTHLSTGQSISTKLDPLAFNLSIGYRY